MGTDAVDMASIVVVGQRPVVPATSGDSSCARGAIGAALKKN